MKKSFRLLSDSDWEPFLDFLLNMRGKARLTVTVQTYRKKRSLSANAYYWSVCIPTLAEHFGYRPEEMHTVLLGTYVGWDERKFRDQTLFVPHRTSTSPEIMDTMDFQGLIQTAQQIAAEEGLILIDQREETDPRNQERVA